MSNEFDLAYQYLKQLPAGAQTDLKHFLHQKRDILKNMSQSQQDALVLVTHDSYQNHLRNALSTQKDSCSKAEELYPVDLLKQKIELDKKTEQQILSDYTREISQSQSQFSNMKSQWHACGVYAAANRAQNRLIKAGLPVPSHIISGSEFKMDMLSM